MYATTLKVVRQTNTAVFNVTYTADCLSTSHVTGTKSFKCNWAQLVIYGWIRLWTIKMAFFLIYLQTDMGEYQEVNPRSINHAVQLNKETPARRRLV